MYISADKMEVWNSLLNVGLM